MNTFTTSILLTLISIAACNKTTSHVLSETDTNELSVTSHSSDGYFGPYNIIDESYGTKTTVTIDKENRIIKTNALPNHVTGIFPNKGNPNTIRAQDITYTIPINPTYTGEAKWARQPGVALNGIKFEPQTAEVVQCEGGEQYRIEAIQELINMGLDSNIAHVQPTGAYHYHGAGSGLIQSFDTGQDMVHVGFALDGYAIYYSKSGVFSPSFQLKNEERSGSDCSYSNPHTNLEVDLTTTPMGTFVSDWEYVKEFGDLDECNGLELNGQYTYIITNDYPYVGRCLMGAFEEQRPPRGGRRGPPPPRGSKPPQRSGN